ncbi:hypothetical protein FVR03_15490 [Pontibacter qinzhouensis]|uniref:Uncharacterized protein n=1 Tax=Pontibacter qinzhouensis TaxID=2603253 RepID=A0A5C8JJA2_9BACT|nr:hypothetical protein [Pontibacter qinzhouensis]TXK37411.1 hypothetical protein FVR03_15490 [Pontibacter qinzhouensis]
MPNYNLTWQDTDVQLLEALLLATGGEGGAPLQEVLLMSDALEGVVLSLQEVQDAFLKLIAAGYIAIQKNKLLLTPEFLLAYEEITLREGMVEADEQKPLLTLLQQQSLNEQQLEEVNTSILKKYKLKNQYQQYLEQFG